VRKYFGFFLLLTIIIAGCGVPSGQLRIRGEYQHLDQADFLLYSMDGGLDWVDTLHIRQGEFDYFTSLPNKATYHILYPNNDELVIWAHSGDDVVIEGDAQNLFKVKVKGNEENELYTAFRQQLADNDTVTIRRAAASFIRQHAQSPVSLYLLDKYFLQCTTPLPRDSVQRLYQVLRKALPRDNEISLLGGRIQQRYALQKGKSVPAFDLLTAASVHHRLSDYHGHTLLLYFWAGWLNSTQGTHRIIADTMAVDKNLRALSYSLDVDSITFHATKGDSTLSIPVYCDYLGFQSPLVKQLGITQLPMAVIIDEKGRIKCTDKDVIKALRQR